MRVRSNCVLPFSKMIGSIPSGQTGAIMSYRDNETFDSTAGRRSLWYWPVLNSLDESYAVARKSFGGWVFAGMIVLGVIAILFTGKSPGDLKTPETNVGGALVAMTIEFLFVLIASYRIRIGRGWTISWILFTLFIVESVFKVMSGGALVIGWIFFYVGIGASILAGARACWDIRSRLKAGESRTSQETLQTVFE